MPRSAELDTDSPDENAIDVVVGIISDTQNRVLVGQRPAGKPMPGEWEFPGGKLHSGELPLNALKRELYEELGIVVSRAERFLRQSHRYPGLQVHLDVWWVLDFDGDVMPLESQVLRWVAAAELDRFPLLPADAPIVNAIRERLLG